MMFVTKIEIQNLIADGQLDSALANTKELSKTQKPWLEEQIVQLMSRFSNLEHKERMGLIDFDVATRERNQITKSLLDLLSGLSDEAPATRGAGFSTPPAGQVNQIGTMNGGQISYNANQPAEPAESVLENARSVKKILILASNPSNEAQLRLNEEVREIGEGLRRSNQRDKFRLVNRLAVRVQDLNRALLDESPNIVHFCGHGSGDAGLMLEDRNGKTQLVGTQALTGLFSLFADSIECVVLNACYSEVQADEIVRHIPYVIGMGSDVLDTSAIQFATSFYDALASGRSIEFAFQYACNAIDLNSLDGMEIPKLKKKGAAA